MLVVNFFRIYKYSRRIDRLDKDISKFIQTTGWALTYREINEIRYGRANLGAKVDKCELKMEEIGDKIENLPESFQRIMKDRMDELENGKKASPMSIPKLPDFSVGLEISVSELKKRLLCKDVQLVGVVGMGGSGKTTLATAFCNDKEVQDHFKKRIVFETVSRSPNIIEILGSMWRQLAGKNETKFRDIENARRQLQNELCLKESRPTLVVLDDVWEKCDLDKLMFEGAGYKTLITTRNNQILISDQQYENQLLKPSDAVSLFCHFAFRQPSIPETADGDLVKEVIAKCDGLPLALEVIGRSLNGLLSEAWVTAKKKLSEGQPVSDDHKNALRVMGTSVDILEKEVRECFLDMGIFEEARNISADMLLDLAVYVHGLERAGAYTILVELASRNLVKLVNNQKDTLWDSYEWQELSFTQHDILRELAINLTNEEETIVNRRKRLTMTRKAGVSFGKMWKKHADDVPVFNAEIVSFNTGSMQEEDWCYMDFPNIKALILNFSASKYFLPPFMQSMRNLEVLIIINHNSKRATLEGISVLCSLTGLKVVRLERVIVPPLQEYCQSWRKLERLSFILCEGFKDMTQLNMGWCLNFPRLLEFTIDHCIDLKELPASICQMTSLERLSVTNCHDFTFLDDIGMLSSLKILRLCGCPSLKEVPDSICKLRQLQFLDISSCYGIERLPDEIGRLSSLKKLDMRECSHVEHVPGSACHLKPHIQRVICCEKIEPEWSQMIDSGKVEAAEEKFGLDWLDR